MSPLAMRMSVRSWLMVASYLRGGWAGVEASGSVRRFDRTALAAPVHCPSSLNSLGPPNLCPQLYPQAHPPEAHRAVGTSKSYSCSAQKVVYSMGDRPRQGVASLLAPCIARTC